MGKISKFFSGKYFKGIELKDEPFTGIISHVTVDELGMDKERVPVIHFKNSEKALTLNKTRATIVADLYGDETDNWKGQPLELVHEKTSFQGKMYDGIGVQKPAKAVRRTESPQAPAPEFFEDPVETDDSDIPW